MGRIADIASGKTSVGGGRLSGVVSSESAVNEKNKYYLDVEKKNRYAEAIKKAEKAQEEAQKASENLKFWEGIAGIPKQIYQAGKETGAAVIDVASRISPVENVRNTYSGISNVLNGPSNVPADVRYEQGFQESKGRKTLFEKVSGKELTNPDGSINWDAGRQFIGRAAEAPTYAYAGAVKGAELVGKGLLSRILTRTVKSTPEAAVNTGIQQFEQGNTENVGTNFLANALLLSGISNIASEVRFSKDVAKKTIDDIESELGTLSLSEKADVIESIQQGVKPGDIVENVRKVKNDEVKPEELASKINEQAGVTESPKTTEAKPEDPLLQEAKKYSTPEEFVKGVKEIGMRDFSPQNAPPRPKLPEAGISGRSESLIESAQTRLNDATNELQRIKSQTKWKSSQPARIAEAEKSVKFWSDRKNALETDLKRYQEEQAAFSDFHKNLTPEKKVNDAISRGTITKEEGALLLEIEKKKITNPYQLTDIWKQAQEKKIDTSIPEQPKADVTPGKGESVTAKKMNARFGKDEQLSTEYDIISINKESDAAASRILKDRNEAIQHAFTDTGSNTEKIAILNELFEKSVVDNDHELSTVLFNRIKQLSTQTAQSLNMFKALTEVNPHYAYMSEVVSARLNGVKVSAGNIIDALKKESKQSRIRTKVSKQTKELKETLSSSVKYEKAQKVFNDLICK